jgi:hypothetical protein
MITVLLWAAFAACALLAASGLWRVTRTRGASRDPGSWHAPLIFTSAAAALLAALGVLAPAGGALLALIPLLVIAMIVARAWQAAARALGVPKATALVLRGLAARVRDALRGAGEDLRVLVGRSPECAPQPAAAEPVIARPRRAPSTARPDLLLGPALVPEQVAAELEAARVAVPACWAAVAEWEASFEPENGEDWRQHIAERAAGILTVAEVAGGQAEDLGTSVKLDPAVITAETDFAEDFADTASAAVRSIQVYDSVYDGAHEHVENGGTLPEDARGWFGADGRGGQAA